MCAKRISLGVALVLGLFVFGAGSGATWYVDGLVAEPGDGRSWGTAFQKIQGGIDAALNGDTVIVAEGTYVEKISFDGKNITLTSTAPLVRAVVENTVIDGNQSGSVVTFAGTEEETCVLSGFTIQNGKADYSGICGGTADNQTHASIQNCVITANSDGAMCLCSGIIRNNTITGNSGSYGGGLGACNGTIEDNVISRNAATYGGGGLYGCDGSIRNNLIAGNSAPWGGGVASCQGTIQHNVITNNSSSHGGGLRDCDGLIHSNTISGNEVDGWGGGLNDCDGLIHNNTISANSALLRGGGLCECASTIENNRISGNSAGQYGGGLAWCDGTIRGNIISANWAGDTGGGLHRCAGPIQNSTICDNSAINHSGGLFSCPGIIRNCIIWGNGAPLWPQLSLCSDPAYSCIQGGAAGEENIDGDPGFVDSAGGDYCLSEGSPCIDTGDSSGIGELPPRDAYGQPRIRNGIVDMGASEFQAGSSNIPWISEISTTAEGYRISWADVVPIPPGYILEWTDDLASANWAPFPTTSELSVLDGTAAERKMRFYRLRLAE
jgi:hypothetical protein